MAAHVSRDQDLRQSQTVRELVAQFRALSGSLKRTQVMDEADISGRTTLAEFFTDGGTINRRRIAQLDDAMIENSKPVKPTDMRVIGGEYLSASLVARCRRARRPVGMDVSA